MSNVAANLSSCPPPSSVRVARPRSGASLADALRAEHARIGRALDADDIEGARAALAVAGDVFASLVQLATGLGEYYDWLRGDLDSLLRVARRLENMTGPEDREEAHELLGHARHEYVSAVELVQDIRETIADCCERRDDAVDADAE